MNYAELQRIIQETNKSYAEAQASKVNDPGRKEFTMKAAVDARNAAIQAYNASQAQRQPTVNTGQRSSPPPPPPPPKPVKIPERSLVNLSTEGPSTSLISNLLFERLGSVEIATIARRDTVEGQNPLYSFISNLASIRVNFDPTRLITQQRRINQNFDIYTINLDEKIPDDQYLAQNNLTSFYYIDTNGDLVIEIDNLEVDEVLDLEIANSGTINLVDES